MKKEVSSNAAKKAENKYEIRKVSDYKARKGYKLITIKYIQDVVTNPEHKILGLAYYWTEDGKKELRYVLEMPENEAKEISKYLERLKGANRREYRHRIWNKKHTKLIMCPFTNSCQKCPFADHPEEIYPSLAEEHKTLSFDNIIDDKEAIPPSSYGSVDSMLRRLETEEMMEEIETLDDPIIINFVQLVLCESDYNEIKDKLGLTKREMAKYLRLLAHV